MGNSIVWQVAAEIIGAIPETRDTKVKPKSAGTQKAATQTDAPTE